MCKKARIIRLGQFIAVLEGHTRRGREAIWRYVIKYQDTGEEFYDGWAGDLLEAQESAERGALPQK